MVICMGIVLRGVHDGIERACRILMPTLVVILIILMFRSLTLPGAMDGIEFYLKPDFSKIDHQTILIALGQSFFSLSLGMGCMLTYGSYLPERENLASATVYVVFFDTMLHLNKTCFIFTLFLTFSHVLR